MKNTVKALVLAFLQALPKGKSEQYNKAYELYRQSPDKDLQMERYYNTGFSEMNLANLLYDLQKINGITDLEVRSPKEPEAVATNSSEEIVTDLSAEAQTTEATPAINLQVVDATPAADFVPSPDAEERKRLRDEFPFLDEPGCPIELRALMTDKISHYRKYVTSHNKLQAHLNGTAVISDENELQEVTKSAVEDFEANRAIYEELNFFAAHGKIFGRHPIFRELTLQLDVNAMSNDELVKYLNSSKKFFSTKKKQIAEAKGDAVKIAKYERDIALRNEKLALVKKRLELSATPAV